jgi:hypothetical protein
MARACAGVSEAHYRRPRPPKVRPPQLVASPAGGLVNRHVTTLENLLSALKCAIKAVHVRFRAGTFGYRRSRWAMLQAFAQALIHVPGAVRRLDETICSGGGGIAKDLGVVNRIDSVQAAWPHRPSGTWAAFRESRRSSAENEGCNQGNLGLGRHLESPSLVCPQSTRV